MPKRQRKEPRQARKTSKERALKERILIVCEGKKTEPSYFKQLRDKLEIEKVSVDVKHAKKPSPDYIFNFAKDKQDQAQRDGNAYEKIYCVFDKDDHEEFQKISDEINSKKKDGFEKARSSPCIEYWFLLHFTYTDKDFTDSEECLNDLKGECRGYDKEITNAIFETLWDKKDTAKKNAEKSVKNAKSSLSTSFTEVYLLLEELENLAS